MLLNSKLNLAPMSSLVVDNSSRVHSCKPTWKLEWSLLKRTVVNKDPLAGASAMYHPLLYGPETLIQLFLQALETSQVVLVVGLMGLMMASGGNLQAILSGLKH